MKRLLLVLLTICSPCFFSIQAQNIEGQIIASQYGQWKVAGYAPDTYTFSPTACRVQGGNSFFPAFAVGTPILIVDGNPALDEVVTPSSVVNNNVTCSISINPTYNHNLPFYLTSATGGLQEAINANSSNPGTNTIILNNAWHELGGSSETIASVTGTAQLGLIDITTTPSTWYRWNGAAYVVVPVTSTVTSVFGRTGAITAQAGDYTCAEVTGCLTSAPVTSVFNRVGAVTAESGDYTCSQVTGCPTGTIVNSFNGRSGSVDPASGDYTCFLVTGCGAAPVTGFTALLDASQGSGDTTLSIDSVIGTIPASGGYYHLDSEWEEFTGVTNLGGGDYQLTGVTRAQFATTAAAHSSGAGVISMIQGLVAPSLTNFAWVGGTATSGYFLALDCPFGSSANDTVLFEVGCASGSDSFSVGDGGNFAENSAYPSYFFNSTLSFNDSITGSKDLLDNAYALTRSNLVAQVSLPNQFTASVGFGAGIPGGVEAVQAPTAGAPYLVNLFVPSGSTTNTYVCQGTDAFGGNIPGTSASIENLASSGWGSGNVIVYCPPIPGAVSTSLYRTAGVPNTGLLKTSSVPQLTYQDFYATATSGTPNPTNTTVPVVCAGGQQFCLLSGTSGTPPITCTASQQGWEYFDTTSADAPIQFCESDAWTVFAGGGGSSAFSALTGGTNTSAAMVVGSGASLGVSGTGTIAATSAPYSGLTGTVPTWNQDTTGNAATATVLAATPTVCSSGQAAQGVLANGNATGCFAPGDTITSPNSTLTVGGSDTATTLDINLGNSNTWTAAQANSTSGAASKSAMEYSGSPYMSGSGTTNIPLVYLDNGATAPTTWSTGGTYLGINAVSGFTGKFIDFHVNGGSSVFGVQDTGQTISASTSTFTHYFTVSNCASSASPATCGTASSGAVAVPTGGATLVVDNTSVTASSQIQLTFDSSLGSLLGVTCNTTINEPSVSARTASTNFTITMANSVSTNPDCISYTIIN